MSTVMHDATLASSKLPCVVQVGFAGSRRLFDLPAGSDEYVASLLREVQVHLTNKLSVLRAELNAGAPAGQQLGQQHFFCGISQIAIGGDTLFTRACHDLAIPQRIFLPQHRDAFLHAVGSSGQPDFTAEERGVAESLLESPHIIQQDRVVSDSADRTTRFEDCNREILRVSDIVVCLFRGGAAAARGGTRDLLELATAAGKPALEIRVVLQDGRLSFVDRWHGREQFKAPALPAAIADLPAPPRPIPESKGWLPSVAEFCKVVKGHVSRQAQRHSREFSESAVFIIGFHILATLCAVFGFAISLSHDLAYYLTSPPFLISELIFLCVGLGLFYIVHKSKPTKIWAMSRLLAEINRSVSALNGMHIYPEFLFCIFHPRTPSEIVALLRTLNVLHLRTTRGVKQQPWPQQRDAYLQSRLDNPDPHQGQIAYYEARCRSERCWLKYANLAFYFMTGLAILATVLKLTHGNFKVFELAWAHHPLAPVVLGTLAIVLPVLAVGILSFGAAKDYEARVHTFEEMGKFLASQKRHLQNANSAREFERAVGDTEAGLLGEVAQWYSRRTHTGVA